MNRGASDWTFSVPSATRASDLVRPTCPTACEVYSDPRILAPRTSSACSSETNTSASDSLSVTTRTIGDIIPNLSELEVEMHDKHRTERRV